jgi:phosphoribosylamine---glycine ligase
MSLKVLIAGKDGRTDAIAHACALSASEPELYAVSELRIPGLLEKCRQVFTIDSLTDVDAIVSIAKDLRPDLAIIGPEEPLAAGCVDALRGLGIACFGPTKALAAVEASKSWTRRLLDEHEIDGNPDYRVFDDANGLRQYIESLGAFVVKPDGLTAGKGVKVSGDHLASVDAGVSYAEACLRSAGRVVIEEKLDGEEFSLQTITDGDTRIHLPLVQDHKRAHEGDRGPNTGGMGSYSCPDFSLPFLTAADLSAAQSINHEVIDALCRETGEPYRGVLYGGFILTRDGLRVVEYNARFGDPEAMNVLSLFEGDFGELCAATASGTLGQANWRFQPKATVCKYVVPAAYPEPTESSNATIAIPPEWDRRDDLRWYWAACRDESSRAYLTGSRAGAVVGIDDSLSGAEQIAESAAREVVGPVRHRADVGTARLVQARVQHMERLRSGVLAG